MPNPYVTPQVRCAAPGCNAVRTESNHWWAIYLRREPRMLSLKPLKDSHLRQRDVLPVCGQTCVSKIVSSFLGGE